MLGAALAASIAHTSWAQPYPTKPIVLVVPFPAGGISDMLSRAIAKRMSVSLGQQVVIDNRPGAGGSLATEQVARTTPDGYTILYGSSGTLAANLALYKNVRYEPARDFVAVHGIVTAPLILVTESSRPYWTVSELVAHARRSPGTVNYGSAGAGTATHLAAALFQARSNTRLVHIPYKGSALSLQDLLGGRLDLMFDYPNLLAPHLKSGRLRALAVLSDRRLPSMREVPTIAEAGVRGAESTAWSGIVAPAGTPAEAVQRLSSAVSDALADESVMGPFIEAGQLPLVDMNAAQFKAHLASEKPRWAGIVRLSGASLE